MAIVDGHFARCRVDNGTCTFTGIGRLHYRLVVVHCCWISGTLAFRIAHKRMARFGHIVRGDQRGLSGRCTEDVVVVEMRMQSAPRERSHVARVGTEDVATAGVRLAVSMSCGRVPTGIGVVEWLLLRVGMEVVVGTGRRVQVDWLGTGGTRRYSVQVMVVGQLDRLPLRVVGVEVRIHGDTANLERTTNVHNSSVGSRCVIILEHSGRGLGGHWVCEHNANMESNGRTNNNKHVTASYWLPISRWLTVR